MFTARQLLATAAISAAAGYFTGGACQPMAERLLARGAESGADGGCEAYNSEANMPQLVGLVAHRAVRQTAPALRNELGAGSSGQTTIEYSFMVGGNGTLQFAGADVSCGGRDCPGTSELPQMIGALIASEWKVEASGRECSMLIRVDIPPVEAQAPSQRIRLPARNGLVDL